MAYNAGASSGNLILIQEQTASNVASIDFTTGISGFDVYYMDFYGVTIATNSQNLLMQLSTDGGMNYSATGYTYGGYFSFSAALLNATSAAFTAFLLLQSIDNSSTDSVNGNCFLYNFANTSLHKKCISTVSGFQGGTQDCIQQTGASWATTTAVNAFTIFASAGNILTGTFKLYGVQN